MQVISSDSQQPRFGLQVSALVGGAPPTLGIVPESGIDFDRFPADERQEMKVELTNYSPQPMYLSIIGAPPEFLNASLSADVVQPRETVSLTVTTRDKPPLGKFQGSLTLLLDEAQETRLTIPISGVSMMK